jgi:Putative transposase, YhgA-like
MPKKFLLVPELQQMDFLASMGLPAPSPIHDEIKKATFKREFHNPHDLYFKFITQFEDPVEAIFREVCKQTLEKMLDAEIESIEPVSTDFVKCVVGMSELKADRIFQIKLRKDIGGKWYSSISFFTLMMEHYKNPFRTVVFKLVEYTAAVMHQMQIRDMLDQGNWPLNLMIVVNQGPTPWQYATEFKYDIDPIFDPLRPYQLHYKYLVFDLTQIDLQQLDTPEWVKIALGAMKAVGAGTTEQWIRDNMKMENFFPEPIRRILLEHIIAYIGTSTNQERTIMQLNEMATNEPDTEFGKVFREFLSKKAREEYGPQIAERDEKLTQAYALTKQAEALTKQAEARAEQERREKERAQILAEQAQTQAEQAQTQAEKAQTQAEKAQREKENMQTRMNQIVPLVKHFQQYFQQPFFDELLELPNEALVELSLIKGYLHSVTELEEWFAKKLA